PLAFLIARSILSLGMFSARAAMTAARRRGFMAGAGIPLFAAAGVFRAGFSNSLDFVAACRPLRWLMFLDWEWPALGCSSAPLAPRARRKARSAKSWDNGLMSGAL